MATDNLTVQISADSSKLRAELSLAQAELRKLQKELRAAADAGDTARVADLSTQYEILAAQIRNASRALSEHNKVAAESKKNWSEMAVGLKEAIAAFAALESVRRIVDSFREVMKSITELRNTAKAAALSPGDVKVFQEVIEDTGESADGARQALVALTDKIANARIQARGFGKDLVAGVNVMRGGQGGGSFGGDDFGVNIVRGGQAAAKSVDELTQKILDNAAKFRDNRRSIQSVVEDLGKLRQRDAALGTAVGVQLLGKKYALFAEALDRLGKNNAWDEVKKQLEEQGRLPTAEAVQRVEDYNKAVDDVGDAFEKLKMAIAIPLLPNVTAGISKFAEMIDKIDTLKDKWNEFKNYSGLTALEEAIFGPVRRGLTSALDAVRKWAEEIGIPLGTPIKIFADLLQLTIDLITGDFSKALTDFGTLASDIWTALGNLIGWVGNQIDEAIGFVNSLAEAAGKVPSWLRSFGGSSATGEVPSAQYASGGMVRGPGSGTSDSILARLSNGEFIMRAAAVRAWGPQLLASMNALNRPLRGVGDGKGFAQGGMVRANTGDGATVNLHFPGGSFALRGDRGIVMGLTREARRAALLSGGRAPGAAVV